jgi:hypothetical protein
MTGRKAPVGLSLLCALAFSAFAASSASAAGTTVFTCEPVKSERQFSDEHCLIAAPPLGEGFIHKELPSSTPVEFEGTNSKTASTTTTHTITVIHGLLAGVIPFTMSCTKLVSTGKLTNNVGPPMSTSGTATATDSECTTVIEGTKKNCKVKEPITWSENLTTVVEGEEMYVKATGSGAGELFASLTFESNGAEVCPKGIISLNPYKVTGAVIGTPNGATLEFKEKEPHSTLKLGGATAELTQIETLRKKGGSPLVFTTTAS